MSEMKRGDPSNLNAKRAVTEALRARASLKAIAAEAPKPPPEVLAPTAVDKGAERYCWRCRVCRLFAKRYAPDKDRMKQAQAFAYSKRAMTGAAFDAGEFKADVLCKLVGLFETSRTPE